MDEKQREEVKNNMVENAKKERTREKSDLDPDAVKVELENELEMLERGECFDDKDDTHQNDNDRSVHPPPDKSMKKPSAELNPVIIIAVIYAVFIKKPEANDDDNDKQLEPGEEWLHSHMTEEDLKNPDKRKELEKMKTSAPLPPELDFLKTAREERSL
ncbi:unnamed protein product [Mytilus edulis]|uniref:Uncharacterized protein n=1 Tax=Mytilus edulis TaxID=6550 RepID=A0A8S3QJQ3_MYTED|nr:unnamed protein product [Mytilus edulis]